MKKRKTKSRTWLWTKKAVLKQINVILQDKEVADHRTLAIIEFNVKLLNLLRYAYSFLYKQQPFLLIFC